MTTTKQIALGFSWGIIATMSVVLLVAYLWLGVILGDKGFVSGCEDRDSDYCQALVLGETL